MSFAEVSVPPIVSNSVIKIPNLQRVRKALWHLRHGGLRQLKAYLNRVESESHNPNPLVRNEDAGILDLEPWKIPIDINRRPKLRVAAILDEFSALAWSFEWDQFLITPKQWNSTIRENSIDLLFVESAWYGNNGAWQYKLTGSAAPSRELRELIEYCVTNKIPTVFWNKEDPVHYDDFIETARLFDYVYTSDETLIPRYIEALGHTRVGTLPFAAQPAIHNPIRPVRGFHSRDIAFGGMYFSHRHPERREQMSILLGAAYEVSDRMKYGLEIYSRFYGKDARYQFPAPLDSRVVGGLKYDQMLSAYRLHKVFLNVNTVTSSPSMCARRIFEITASGTPVVSTPSAAIDRYFSSESIFQVSDKKEATFVLRALVRNEDLRSRSVHRAQREIWKSHTYENRANTLLHQVGLHEYCTSQATASMLISTNRPHQLEFAVKTAAQQISVRSETLVLTHGFSVDDYEINRLRELTGIEHLRFLEASSDLTLGECLNKLIDAADGEVVAKIDDDDIYGPNYLFDQLQALKFSGASVVGKNSHYLYSEEKDLLMLRNPEVEHQFTNFVAGPTIVTTREVAAEIRFEPRSRGEDTSFLSNIVDQGGKIYSADRFNFAQYRRASNTHTWNVGNWELLANSHVSVRGWHPAHVIV